MATTVRIPNGFITLCKNEFNCPSCEKTHTEEDYYDRLFKTKDSFIYMKCKGCKEKLGVTTNMVGDVVAWLKSEEA